MNLRFSYNRKYLYFNNITDSSTPVLLSNGSSTDIILAVSPETIKINYYIFENIPFPAGFLHTKIMLDSGKIPELFDSNESLKYLLNELYKVGENKNFSPEIHTLILYFYLTDCSISVSLMAKWMEEFGLDKTISEKFCTALYIERVERVESSLVNNLFPDITQQTAPEILLSHVYKLFSVEDFFRFENIFKPTRLVFDEFSQYDSSVINTDKVILNCKDIPETAFLVEDHDHIILGLSNNLAEVMTLCLNSLPEFYDFIRLNCNLAERTYKSLHSFLCETPLNIRDFMKMSGMKCMIGVLDKYLKLNYLKSDDCIDLCQSPDANLKYLPVFLNIRKT
ncbi:MAG: hypothetical protein K0B15_13085 [Lentimicrobium sp.]|nr:hypothetical protein [Lentimicrobium sp.]